MNNKGFSLVEVLVASSITFMLLTTIIPMTSLLEQERTLLSQRRTFGAKLHDELQLFLWDDLQIPANYPDVIAGVEVTFTFTVEGEYMKGCVSWKNARKESETICLYGSR